MILPTHLACANTYDTSCLDMYNRIITIHFTLTPINPSNECRQQTSVEPQNLAHYFNYISIVVWSRLYMYQSHVGNPLHRLHIDHLEKGMVSHIHTLSNMQYVSRVTCDHLHVCMV